MGKDIGYLPGTMEEKMAPWLAPIQDNLRFLLLFILFIYKISGFKSTKDPHLF